MASLLTGLLLMPAVALARDFDPDEFTPPGYTYCGLNFFGSGTWVMDPGEDSGASRIAFAAGLSCKAARRNATRIVYQRDGGQPKAPGYRCRYIRQGYEFVDVRCVKKGGGGKFRVQSGS